jgi:uncharacterized protein YutE (UPF0331/DUF86 family)
MEVSFGFGAAGLFLAIAWYAVNKLEHDNPLDDLERLARLKNEGVIDDEEFERIKPKLLKRIRSD